LLGGDTWLIPITNSKREWFLQKKNKNPFMVKSDRSVFLDWDREKLVLTYISTAVHCVVYRMGCDGLGLQGMRHTILTELVQNDVSLEKVRQLVGHSNLKTTEQYLHLRIGDTRSMLETLKEKRDVERP
jgi:site-specific recombinase XerD